MGRFVLTELRFGYLKRGPRADQNYGDLQFEENAIIRSLVWRRWHSSYVGPYLKGIFAKDMKHGGEAVSAEGRHRF